MQEEEEEEEEEEVKCVMERGNLSREPLLRFYLYFFFFFFHLSVCKYVDGSAWEECGHPPLLSSIPLPLSVLPLLPSCSLPFPHCYSSAYFLPHFFAYCFFLSSQSCHISRALPPPLILLSGQHTEDPTRHLRTLRQLILIPCCIFLVISFPSPGRRWLHSETS